MRVRKTMLIGERHTTVKLEEEFWQYLTLASKAEEIRLRELVRQVDQTRDKAVSLASALRVYALRHSITETVIARGEAESKRAAA